MTLHPNSARPKVKCGSCGRKTKDNGLWRHYAIIHDIPERVAKMLAEQDIREQGADRRVA